MAIVMAGAVLNFLALERTINESVGGILPAIVTSHSMRRSAFEAERELEKGADLTSPDSPYHRAIVDFGETLNVSDATIRNRELQNRIRQIRSRFESLQSVTNENRDAARKILSDLQIDCESLFEEARDEVDAINQSTQSKAQGAFVRSVIVTCGALVVAIVLAIRLMRLALTPLAMIAKHADMIAKGELGAKIDMTRRDEVGQLADSFNVMAERLADMRKSEVRRLMRAQLMSDLALESLYDPVIVTDAQGRIRSLNRAAEGLFGSAPTSPRKKLSDHIHEPRIIRVVESALNSRESFASEDDHAEVDMKVGDSVRTYRLRATPMIDDDQLIMGVVLVLEDVTRFKVVDRMKTDFIAVASHELKTPVTSLLLSTQLLEEGAVGELTLAQRVVVKTQREDLERLERLMADLLDMSRLEAGSTPPRFEVVNVEDLVAASIRDFSRIAMEKQVALESSIPSDMPTIRIDRGQIQRVLANLVSNAIRHTDSGGEVKITASHAQDQVVIEVADNGEGIAPEFQERIFHRFVQAPSSHPGGAGLGLAIVSGIVRAHGGKLEVRSEVGRGSVFMITLPVNAHPAVGASKR